MIGKEETIKEAEEIRKKIDELKVRDPEVAEILERIFAWTIIRTQQVKERADMASLGI